MQAVCLIGGRCSAVVDVDVCRRACRNSSHILPPGANVQRSVQPAAIAAAHHGHGPRSPPHTCDDHRNKRGLPASENLGSKPVDGRDLAREQNQVRACPGCALVIHLDGSRQPVDRARTAIGRVE
jgi:hypothetical protein